MSTRLAALLVVLALISPPAAIAGEPFTFECTDPSGPPVTSCDVNLDPNFHDGDPGTLLFHANSAGKRTITLPDLTGSHKIVVRSASKTSAGTNTSVMVINTDPGAACQSGWAPIGYQAWWLDPSGEAFPGRHAHIDNLCFPVNNLIVDGTQTFRVPVQLHAQPAGARLTRVRLKDYPGGTDRWVCTPSSFTLAKCGVSTWPTIDANGNLIAQFASTMNLSNLSVGRHEFRWGVYVEQPCAEPCTNKVQLLSSRSEICIRSCSPVYRSGGYQGNGGWYTSVDYVDARVYTHIPVSP